MLSYFFYLNPLQYERKSVVIYETTVCWYENLTAGVYKLPIGDNINCTSVLLMQTSSAGLELQQHIS